jgi:hypothetical protein
MFSRDKGDKRTVSEVAMDVTHDLYHRAAKYDGHSDGEKKWTHSDECEFTRANPDARR